MYIQKLKFAAYIICVTIFFFSGCSKTEKEKSAEKEVSGEQKRRLNAAQEKPRKLDAAQSEQRALLDSLRAEKERRLAKSTVAAKEQNPESIAAEKERGEILNALLADKKILEEKINTLSQDIKDDELQSYVYRDISRLLERDWQRKLEYVENAFGSRPGAFDVRSARSEADAIKTQIMDAVDALNDISVSNRKRQSELADLHARLVGIPRFERRYSELVDREKFQRRQQLSSVFDKNVRVRIDEVDSALRSLAAAVDSYEQEAARELELEKTVITADATSTVEFKHSNWRISALHRWDEIPATDNYVNYQYDRIKDSNIVLLIEFDVDINNRTGEFNLHDPTVIYQNRELKPLELSQSEYQSLKILRAGNIGALIPNKGQSLKNYRVNFAKDIKLKPEAGGYTSEYVAYAFTVPSEASLAELTIAVRDVAGFNSAHLQFRDIRKDSRIINFVERPLLTRGLSSMSGTWKKPEALRADISQLREKWEVLSDYMTRRRIGFSTEQPNPKENIITMMLRIEDYLNQYELIDSWIGEGLVSQLKKIDDIGSLRDEEGKESNYEFTAAERRLWDEFDDEYYRYTLYKRRAEWLAHLKYEVVPKLIKFESALNGNANEATSAFKEAAYAIAEEEYFMVLLLSKFDSEKSDDLWHIRPELDYDVILDQGRPTAKHRVGIVKALKELPTLFSKISDVPPYVPAADLPFWSKILLEYSVSKASQLQRFEGRKTPLLTHGNDAFPGRGVLTMPDASGEFNGVIGKQEFTLPPEVRYLFKVTRTFSADSWTMLANIQLDEFGDVTGVEIPGGINRYRPSLAGQESYAERAQEVLDTIKMGIAHSKFLPARKNGVRVKSILQISIPIHAPFKLQGGIKN